jgi:hypothetical protein
VNSDIVDLHRRLRTLTRAADTIRRHAADLHSVAWEPAVTDRAHVRESRIDHTPRTGDPRTRQLWERLQVEVGRCEAVLVGLERDLVAAFYAGSSSPEPSRGSLISAADHDAALARQRARPDTPARLVDQPAHPGRRR